MTTFALVHGAWHGAWCWERLVPEIEGHGHAAIAVDLPCDDIEAGCAAYAEVVLAQIAQADDDLVLVGHSLGGLTIPLVAAARPARKLVFLCAAPAAPRRGLRRPGRAGAGIFVPGTGGTERDDQDRSVWTDEDAAADVLYGGCPRQLASWATARLRPQARKPRVEPCPLAEWPAVESVSIFTSDDGIVNPEWSRTAARDRLGANTVELPGGHSPFLGRPAELAEVLLSVSL